MELARLIIEWLYVVELALVPIYLVLGARPFTIQIEG